MAICAGIIVALLSLSNCLIITSNSEDTDCVGMASQMALAAPGPPSAPTGLDVVAEPSGLSLNWTESLNNGGSPVTNYILHAYAGDPLNWSREVWNGQSTRYDFFSVDLIGGWTYHFYVTAINSIGESGNSSEVNISALFIPHPVGDPAASIGTGFANITWTVPTDNGGSQITEYKVQRRHWNAMSLDLEWSNTSVTSTYFNDTSVVNGLLYWYEIAAVNSIGDGWLSNSVEATPGTPSPPLSLSYEEGAGSINLTWSPPLTDNGSPIIEYRVFTGPFGTTLLTTVESSTTYFKVTGITNSNQYFFTIRAVNNNGMSESSNWVSIQMPPHPPSNLTAIAGNGFVNLNWEFIPSSGGQPVYMCNILRKGGNETDWTIIGTVDGTTTRFNDSHEDGHNGPLNGVSYQYYVTASNYAAQSEPSNNISIKVGETPGHPLNLHTGLGKSSISLYWSAPNSDGGCPISWYVIYRGSDPSSLVPLANVSGTLTSFNDSTVIFGEKTYYSVTAVNSIGESDFGDMINATAMAEGNGAGNDIVLLAGIGIIAVVVIATIAFLALRKK